MARQTIYLLPLGSADMRVLDAVKAAVERVFGLAVGLLPSVPVPEYAYNESRGQYRSTTILRSLEACAPIGAFRLLAVADVDLYVPQLNFVFGEATIDGRTSIISLWRLHPEFYGRETDEFLLAERAVKEAVHELGHTFGSRHCPDPRCVMRFSNRIEDTDRKSAEFCGECAESLRARLRLLQEVA